MVPFSQENDAHQVSQQIHNELFLEFITPFIQSNFSRAGNSRRNVTKQPKISFLERLRIPIGKRHD